MADSSYNQVLVIIDDFTNYAEAVPCITASAEETCDHLMNTWVARHGCPMTLQWNCFRRKTYYGAPSDNQIEHFKTKNPKTSGLVGRQNRNLVSMLSVFCSGHK